jgi:hypothetical protein
MASAADSKEPSTELDKDSWKKAEQQFTSYGRGLFSLPPHCANGLAESAAQNFSTPVKTSPTQASNVCDGITVTKRCVKTTSSTILFSNPPSAPSIMAARLAPVAFASSARFFEAGMVLAKCLLYTTEHIGIARKNGHVYRGIPIPYKPSVEGKLTETLQTLRRKEAKRAAGGSWFG